MTPAMMTKPQRILVAEDEAEVRGYLEVALRWLGFSTVMVEDGEEALACLRESWTDYSLVILDLIMPRKDGFETLREIREVTSDLPVIILSSAASPLNIVEAMKGGANDFLAKPVSHENLHVAIEKALGAVTRPEAVHAVPEPAADKAYVARCAWTKKLDMFLKHISRSEVPVLLQGETGVGKEVLARQIHSGSPRAAGPFLKLNCAALPSELIESELFGYERGAFTGAFKSSPGKFEMAESGTILLDEIGDMDFKLQAKLLQVLQDKEFLRLGGKEVCKVDVRVIAATHCDLEQAINEGRFREDLYYRLNIIRVEIPPLRERKDEILPLAKFLVRKHANPDDPPVELNHNLREALMAHTWPGNVRELENVIQKLIALRDPDFVATELRAARRRSSTPARTAVVAPAPKGTVMAAPAYEASGPSHAGVRENPSSPSSIFDKVDLARKQAEVEAIVSALNATRWNRKQAAAILKIEYKALLYKMKKLGIGVAAASAAS